MFDDLKMKVAAEASIQAMHAEMAKLQDFVHDYTELEGRKGEAIAVPVIDLSASAEFNADTNNYCNGQNEVDGALVNLDKHFVKSVMITDRQLAATDFNWLRDIATAETNVIARSINKYVFGLINETNCPLSATLDVSSKTAVANLYKIATDNDIPVGDAVVVLGPVDYAKVLSYLDSNVYGGSEAIREGRIPGLYGFRAFVSSTFLNEGVKGAIVSRDAIGLASRYLEPMEGAYPDAWRASDGDIATIGFRHFSNLCTGRRYLACEALFGAKVLQNKKIIRLV